MVASIDFVHQREAAKAFFAFERFVARWIVMVRRALADAVIDARRME